MDSNDDKKIIEAIKSNSSYHRLNNIDNFSNLLYSLNLDNNEVNNTLKIRNYLLFGYQVIEDRIYEIKNFPDESERNLVKIDELKKYVHLTPEEENIYEILYKIRNTICHRLDF